jgi:predicted ferric reductase
MALPSCQESHRFSQVVCFCCIAWVVAFLLVGGKGKLISIGIGMIPPLVLAAAAVGSLVGRRPSAIRVPPPGTTATTTSTTRRRFFHFVAGGGGGGGDVNLYRATICLIVGPLVLKTIRVALEYAASKPDKVANQLGISTLPAMALSLIPVARYSRIVTTLGWTPPHAIHAIHVSLGWYAVWAGALHVTYYTYVWLTQHEGSWQLFVPDFQCLLDPNAPVPAPCHLCDCSRRLHYVTGLVVFCALATITFTSLPYMRRRYYELFYRVHVMAAPVLILFLYMHWSKTSLYLSGGVIVYLASWAPSYLEQLLLHRRTPARIVAVDIIPCHDRRHVIALTIATSSSTSSSSKSAAYFCAGQYVKLHAPEFSPVSHPFTVVAGPAHDGTIQIMFRQIGVFTHALGSALAQTVTESAQPDATDGPQSCFSLSAPCLPIVRLDGFHGGVDRVHQMLHHDQVVLVAGGIGITPMLTLISRLIADDASSDSLSPLTSVTLHWICRDAALVRYVKERYFDAWTAMTPPQQVSIQCIVHMTALTAGAELYGTAEAPGPAIVMRYPVADADQVGRPFEPSLLSNNHSLKWRRYAAAWNVAMIGGSTLIVYVLYYKVPSRDQVFKALYAPLFVAAWALILSLCIILGAASRSSNYQAVPVVDFFGAGPVLKAKSSFSIPKKDAWNKGCCTWAEQTGRPAISEMMDSLLDRSVYPAVFLCGPASLRSNVQKYVQHRSSSQHCGGGAGQHSTTAATTLAKATTTAVYVEHFEM